MSVDLNTLQTTQKPATQKSVQQAKDKLPEDVATKILSPSSILS